MKVEEVDLVIHSYHSILLRLTCYVRRMLLRQITATEFFTLGFFDQVPHAFQKDIMSNQEPPQPYSIVKSITEDQPPTVPIGVVILGVQAWGTV